MMSAAWLFFAGTVYNQATAESWQDDGPVVRLSNSTGKAGIGVAGPNDKKHVSGNSRFETAGGQIQISTQGVWHEIITHPELSEYRRDITPDTEYI